MTGTGTKYINGTSQATPVVTGVAALIFGQQPTRPISEVRAALLDSVDKRPAYAGKSVTGGRVNANSAVSAGAAILAARTARSVPSRLSLAKRSFTAMRGKGLAAGAPEVDLLGQEEEGEEEEEEGQEEGHGRDPAQVHS